jgi:chromosome segregation ATPase
MAPSASEDDTEAVSEPLPSIEVVQYALTLGNRKPTFLKNIDKHSIASRPTKSQLEVRLEAERVGNEELRSIIEELKKAKEDAKAKRLRYVQEMQTMRKEQKEMQNKQDEGNALLQQLLAKISQQQQEPSRDGADR